MPNILKSSPPIASWGAVTVAAVPCSLVQVFADGLKLIHIQDSVIFNNSAATDGGCLWAGSNGCVALINSVLSGCRAGTSGGAGWLGMPIDARRCEGDVVAGLQLPPTASLVSGYGLPSNGTLAMVARDLQVRGSLSTDGGGLMLQMQANTSAVMEGLTATDNEARFGNGGAMAVTGPATIRWVTDRSKRLQGQPLLQPMLTVGSNVVEAAMD